LRKELGLVRNNIPFLIYQCIRYGYPPNLQLKGEEIWFVDSLVLEIRLKSLYYRHAPRKSSVRIPLGAPLKSFV